ncbi:MAG: carboxypeptidase-like regulatory domain-containing protein, partial [Nitrososphaerota archaeon]|nr:carboxypeptidase-like regulatory domain-containing protein [Nitrososphaerota archaeon]
ASITTSRSTTSFTILYGLGTIHVTVKGSAGQMLAGAVVELYREGVLYKTGVTDEKGAVAFTDLPAGTYTVKVAWKGYRDEKTVTLSDADIRARKPATVEFNLPPFTEIAGIPLDFGTFVALILGIILLVIVLAVIISEYVRWRGRRLGIYPPPPPKK